jgi:ketosteroid isomerase-like protein
MQHIDDMLKILFSALTLCLLAIPPFIRAQEESESAKVQALEVKLMESYRQRQIEAFAAMLDKDFVITIENGSTYGKTGYVSFTATPSVRIDAVEMSDLKIRMHGNTAVLTGAYHERGENKGIAYDYRDRFTDVWMKSDGRWLLVASHYSIPAKQ